MKLCGLGSSEAYDLYLTEVGGNIDESTWTTFFARAAAFVSTMTRGKSETKQPTDVTERCLMAVGSIIEGMNEASATGGGVISESNDGVSVTYAASKDTRTNEQKYASFTQQYLAGTDMLFRGIPHRRGF